MSAIILRICDACGAEQRSDEDIYWARRHAKVLWNVPPDGINGGTFRGIFCANCRAAVCKAIDDVLRSKRQPAELAKGGK